MNKLILIFFSFAALIFIATTAECQNKKIDCSSLKNGTFYLYPKNSSGKYICKRDGNYQYEKSLIRQDTVVFKIEWLNDCKYALQLISTNTKMNDDAKELWQNHKLVYDIIDLTQDYYVYQEHVDKTTNLPISTDTMWMNEKTNIASKELIQPVKNDLVLKKSHFSDTSKYAVLYLYRSGKFAASQVDMLTYFDNNLIYDSKSGSSFIFKILKEGNFELASVSDMNKKSVTLPLTIKFGQKYYVSSSAKFAMNMASMYVPILKLVDAAEGAEAFQNAY